MPDVCIAYKLHLECTQLINLYDWLQVNHKKSTLVCNKTSVYRLCFTNMCSIWQAFVTVVTSEEEMDEEKIKNPDKELQYPYAWSVSFLTCRNLHDFCISVTKLTIFNIISSLCDCYCGIKGFHGGSNFVTVQYSRIYVLRTLFQRYEELIWNV